LAGVTPEKLHRAYLRGTAPRPVLRVDMEHVAPIRASVADAVAELVEELPPLGRATFRRLTAGLAEPLAVIVRFLAVLEMCKQGLVELEQAANFADLHVTWMGTAELDRSSIEEYQG
jgi:segregation and condensation protein A